MSRDIYIYEKKYMYLIYNTELNEIQSSFHSSFLKAKRTGSASRKQSFFIAGHVMRAISAVMVNEIYNYTTTAPQMYRLRPHERCEIT